MASNESIFEKLNLSSGERRLVMIVIVVLMCALAWMVWGMIPDPGEPQKEIDKEKTQLISFENEITITYTIHKGDTLSTIAKKHKTTAAAIAKANDITPPTTSSRTRNSRSARSIFTKTRFAHLRVWARR